VYFENCLVSRQALQVAVIMLSAYKLLNNIKAKFRDDEQLDELTRRNVELENKLKDVENDIKATKQATIAQDLTFRVIQERLGNYLTRRL
jgi:predicted phage-related endonuclease